MKRFLVLALFSVDGLYLLEKFPPLMGVILVFVIFGWFMATETRWQPKPHGSVGALGDMV